MAAIAVFTDTGNTARLISKYRPKSVVYAFSHVRAVCNRMNLLWGVHPVLHAAEPDGRRNGRNFRSKSFCERKRVKPGDVLGVVGGTRMSTGSTNFMRLQVVQAAAKGT